MLSRRYLLLITLTPVIIGGVLVLSYWAYRARSQARLWVYPARHVAQETPAAYGLPIWETVSFTNGAGLELVGWLIEPIDPPNGQTVILVHGLSGHRGGMLPRATILAHAGYRTFLFDLRNHGQSQGTVTTMGYEEGEDVVAAAAYLRSRGDIDPNKMAVWGHSLGAVAVINAAAADARLRAVIAESGFPNLKADVSIPIVRALTGRPPVPTTGWVLWFMERETGVPVSQLDLYPALTQISPRPILFIHGLADEIVLPVNSERMYAAASQPKTLFLVPDGDHSVLNQSDPAAYSQQIRQFLGQAFAE